MKTKILLTTAGVVAAAIIIWLIIHKTASSTPLWTTKVTAPLATQLLSSTATGAVAPVIRPPDLPPAPSKEQQMSNMLPILNTAPINFYGRLLDQYNAPVADATVKGSVLRSEKWMDQERTDKTTTTDSEGLFRFEGLSGMSLGIWFQKDGYEYTSSNNSFTYSRMWPEKERHKPDVNNPVTFHIWKLQGPQGLTRIHALVAIPEDGTPTYLDLLTGRRTAPESSDLTVSFARTPQDVGSVNRFAWKLIVSFRAGGVEAENDQYPNEAPEGGYQDQIVVDMPTDAPAWRPSYRQSFYLKARSGGIYARISINVFAAFAQDRVPFELTGFANIQGSRNLETTESHFPQ
jgi:hypothetical protein